MLGPFQLAQKSCLVGKLFLTYLPSLPSVPIWRLLNLKLAWNLQKLQRLLAGSFLKTLSLFSLTCPWKLTCRKSLFVECTYCMVVSRLIPFKFLLWSRITGRFSFSSKFRNFRLEIKWRGPFRFGPTGIFGTTFEGGPLWLVWSFLSVGPKCPFPFDKIVGPSTALLNPAYKNSNQTRGGLGRVCVTGMYRSIGHVEFSKFQTGIFAKWIAPTFS